MSARMTGVPTVAGVLSPATTRAGAAAVVRWSLTVVAPDVADRTGLFPAPACEGPDSPARPLGGGAFRGDPPCGTAGRTRALPACASTETENGKRKPSPTLNSYSNRTKYRSVNGVALAIWISNTSLISLPSVKPVRKYFVGKTRLPLPVALPTTGMREDPDPVVTGAFAATLKSDARSLRLVSRRSARACVR